MKKLVEFPLEDGGAMMVEVDEPEHAGRTLGVSRGGEKTVEKANQSFESALDKVKPTANAVISKLRDLVDPPDEISVEFGLKLGAETGAILASAAIEANYKVTLTWQKDK